MSNSGEAPQSHQTVRKNAEIAQDAARTSPSADRLSHTLDRRSKKGIICDIDWLSGYICHEHYYLIKLLEAEYGFDVINSKKTDLNSVDTVEMLNTYAALLIAYQGQVDLPIEKMSAYKIFRIDDLVSYNETYDRLLARLISGSDMIISPYAYAFHQFFDHGNVVWLPYSSAIEGYSDAGFNNDPIQKVVVSGSVAWDRPFRQYAAGLKSEHIEILEHPGYKHFDNNSDEIVRGRYYHEMSKYLCGFADAHKYRYLHLKAFEIASVGSLLLADNLIEREMNELGFIDYKTCIFADQESFLERVIWICDEKNRADVDRIRRAGMDLVKEKHLTTHRAKQLNDIVNNAISPKHRTTEAPKHA